MEGDPDSDVEYEIVDDEVEHEELGGVDFEPEIVDPVSEQVDAGAPEPMVIDEDEEQDSTPETKSEAMRSSEESEPSKSSSESLGSDPDWVP
ncbi:hypothetical protein NL676_010631 [Syzygium grande]|nr:hypothetical protein NL676_010631 [Syzygium grande]